MARSLEDLVVSANSGDTESQFQLGMKLASGDGVYEIKEKKSLAWASEQARLHDIKLVRTFR